MSSRDSRLAPLISVVAFVATILLAPGVVEAAQWDPIPAFPADDHLAVKSSVDNSNYDSARRCLQDFESDVGVDYYAVVVEVTAESGTRSDQATNAVPYVDATYQKWASQGDLDDRHIIIALGLENHSVAIHPGTRWVQLGFERGTIKRTIDNSGFKRFARSGDFPGAICKLVQAVDRELNVREQKLDQKKDKIRTRSDDLTAAVDEIKQRAGALSNYSDPLVASLDDTLSEARRTAVEAKDAVKRERMSAARSKLKAARNRLNSAEKRVEEYQSAIAKLPELRAYHDDTRARIDDRFDANWTFPKKAKSKLETCGDKTAEIEQRLQAGKPLGSTLDDTERCYDEIGPILERADTRFRWWTLYVPAGTGGLLFVLLGVFAFRRRREHNRLARSLKLDLDTWDEKLANASTRLTKLEQEHSFYFSAGTENWDGDSEALSRECANAVNHAFLLYSEARKLHDKARDLYDNCGALSLEPLQRADELLTSETIEFDTNVDEDRRRIYLPLTEQYSGTARELLGDLQSSYRRALDKIDEVEQTLETSGNLLERARTEVARADEAISERRELELPVDHLVDTLQPHKESVDRARSLQPTDPVRSIDLLEEHLPAVESVADRGELGNSMVSQIRTQLSDQLEELRARVADLRDRDYEVAEPDFDPDLRLERTERDMGRVQDIVHDGREHEAEDLFDTVAPNLAEIDQNLDVIEAAPETIPETLDELKQDRRALKDRIPEARSILEELRENHAVEAFEKQSDNLEQLAPVLDDLEGWLNDVDEDFERAHYLSATADAQTARNLIGRGNELVDEIEQIDEKLERAIDDAKTEYGDIKASYNDFASLVSEHEPAIPAHLQEIVTKIGDELADVEDVMDEERPNWFEIRSRLRAVRKRVDNLRPRAEQNIDDWESADALASKLKDKLQTLRQSVESETRDRQHVHTKLNSAIEKFTEWSDLLEDSDKGGTALLRRGRKVEKSYRRANDAWQSEIEAIETFEREYTQVQNRLTRVDGQNLGYSVYVDCSSAQRTLDDAQAAASDKRWRTAIERVEEARRDIDRAVDAAEDEYEIVKDRRTDDMSSSFSSSSSSSSSSLFSSSSSSYSRSSSSSFTSSSSSSGSSFGSSSSGGSSFGGTSSGGSSFGGSSSGGSSW